MLSATQAAKVLRGRFRMAPGDELEGVFRAALNAEIETDEQEKSGLAR